VLPAETGHHITVHGMSFANGEVEAQEVVGLVSGRRRRNRNSASQPFQPSLSPSV